MKRFELSVGGVNYMVEGESLDAVWPDGLPKVWADNQKDVTETDITQEIADADTKQTEKATNKSLFDGMSELPANATLSDVIDAFNIALKAFRQ